ncbi:MAG: hypothetical protein LLG02_08350 [Pelosinus sp.]|nr:hypothetical protein [Pelosinus sp.]
MKTLNKKIAVGLLLGSLCALSVGTAVFASSQNNQDGTPSAMCQDFRSDKGEHQRPHPMMEAAKEKLDKLVKDGAISEEQKSKLVAFFNQKGTEMKANMEKMKGMSQEERQAYFQQMRNQHPDFVGEIKNAAGLTDDQAKSVLEALRPKHHQMNPEKLAQSLSKLVSDSTISQDQADSVVNFFKAKAAEFKAEMTKVKEMSKEDRQAYFDKQHKNHPNMINDLKSAANLSDEQAKAVADAICLHHGHGPQDQGAKEPVNQ